MWWKTIPVHEFPEQNALPLRGISWLPSKQKLPILWRLLWPWHIFLVNNAGSGPWYGYFKHNGGAMRTRTCYDTPYAGVRLGNGDVRFAFTDVNGKPLYAERQTEDTPFNRERAKRLGKHITLI